jgi:hypothetical protein
MHTHRNKLESRERWNALLFADDKWWQPQKKKKGIVGGSILSTFLRNVDKFYRALWHHIAEDIIPQLRPNLKSHIYKFNIPRPIYEPFSHIRNWAVMADGHCCASIGARVKT